MAQKRQLRFIVESEANARKGERKKIFINVLIRFLTYEAYKLK